MHDISEVWHWTQRIAGVLVVVCASLYIIRCLTTGSVVTFDQFDHFMRGLVRTIFV
jgi:hypothetical protein